MRARHVLVTVLTIGLLAAPAHGAHARLRDDPRIERLRRLEAEVDRLLVRLQHLERAVGRAAVSYLDAARAAEAAAAAVDQAQARLDERVRTAYQLGPGATLEAFLAAETLADVAAISEYTARTIALDERALQEVTRAQILATSSRAAAEAELRALTPRLQALRATVAAMQPKLTRAAQLARRARVEHARLVAQRRAVAEAVLRADVWEDLRTLTWQEDQAPFLALLGPTGGQTCDTPAGLIETGETFAGYASWYGWEFGGQPTAMGAIFDPRLFTAANRWLPLGSFLRVRNGDRCAIVLVNDRGPYGRLERVIDLSEAAARYLGVGVTWVQAEVLVVAPPG
jgi:hypothetical protein